jgi:hypothetical protein
MEACVFEDSFAPRALTRHGGALHSCVLAVDAAQGLLALAAAGAGDGDVRLLGCNSQECVLSSPCAAPTKLLRFLPQAPYLLRVSSQSELELWCLRELRLEASTLWPGDVTAVCSLVSAPSMLLIGEEDGTLRAARFRPGAVEPRELALSYAQLHGSPAAPQPCGALLALALQPGAEDGRVLVAHACGAVALLELATRAAVASVFSGDELTDAAWLDASTFVTGHARGAVRLWSLPEAAAPWRAAPPAPAAAQQVAELCLGDGGVRLQAKRSDAFVATCGEAAFLVSTARAAGVALAAQPLLPGPPGGVHSLVDAGAFLLALSAGGGQEPAAFVHRLQPGGCPWERAPLGFPAESVTCARLMCGSAAPLLAALRRQPADDGALSLLFRSAACDAPPCGAGRLLATGHAGGAVRLCDASGAGLPICATLAVDADVVCLDVCLASALCAVCTAADVTLFAVDAPEAARCGGAPLDTPPLCVALCTAASMAAIGGADGTVALLQLPACADRQTLHAMPAGEATVSLLSVDGAELGPLLLALGAMASVAVVRCASGEVCGTTQPKTPSAGVALFGALCAAACRGCEQLTKLCSPFSQRWMSLAHPSWQPARRCQATRACRCPRRRRRRRRRSCASSRPGPPPRWWCARKTRRACIHCARCFAASGRRSASTRSACRSRRRSCLRRRAGRASRAWTAH